MPMVLITITDEDVSRAQKSVLIAGVTRILHETLGETATPTMVVIDEVQLDNVGLNGLGALEFRKRALAGRAYA